jgi:hypothetical protein
VEDAYQEIWLRRVAIHDKYLDDVSTDIIWKAKRGHTTAEDLHWWWFNIVDLTKGDRMSHFYAIIRYAECVQLKLVDGKH